MVVSNYILLTLFLRCHNVAQLLFNSAQFAAAQAELGRQWNDTIVVNKS